MQDNFVLSCCESTVDLPYDYVAGRNISVIRDGADYIGKLFINHSHCADLAEMMKQALIPYLGNVAENAPVYEIGSIIAFHCGSGTVAVFFFGDEREG